jgi:WD40 repeat protein
MQILTGLGKGPAALAFSPDGRYLAGAGTRAHHLWDLSAGPAPLWSARHPPTSQLSLGFAPDGLSVVGRTGPDTFLRYAVRTGEATADAPLNELDPLLFSPDGRLAVAATPVWKQGLFGMLCARAAGGGWNTVWQKEYPWNPEFGGWAAVFQVLAFAPDSARLARVFRRGADRPVADMGIEVFAAESGEPVARWEGKLPCHGLQGSAVSRTGAVVVLHTRALYAIDAAVPGSVPVKRPNASAKHFTSAAFSRGGSRLATTNNETAATIWDATTWEVRRQYAWDIGRLRVVCFAPDGLRCAAASDTGRIVVWDLDE